MTLNIKQGFAALPVVLMVMAVVLVIGATLTVTGINATRNSLSLLEQYQANAWANACAEDGLLYLTKQHPDQTSGGYSLPNGIINLDMPGNCAITFSDDVTNRYLNIIGTATSANGTATRRLRLILPNPITPTSTPTEWQEVAGFVLPNTTANIQSSIGSVSKKKGRCDKNRASIQGRRRGRCP